jgi:two-component system alkaline phosphatase synthesis response regulator PhoP
MTRIVVVEDETHIAHGLRFNFEAEGFDVAVFEAAEPALAQLLTAEDATDLLVLDAMLPGMDGFEMAARLRQANRFLPILMLTALGRPEDVLKGFASGADDYLAKPFDLKILLARVNGLLRRQAWTQKTSATQPREGLIEFAGNSVDCDVLELRTPSAVHRLTLMELELLRYLIKHQGSAVSRHRILQDVWGLPKDLDTRAIDNFIVRLRRYIESDPTKPRHLLTVRGVGYKFVAEPQA